MTKREFDKVVERIYPSLVEGQPEWFVEHLHTAIGVMLAGKAYLQSKSERAVRKYLKLIVKHRQVDYSRRRLHAPNRADTFGEIQRWFNRFYNTNPGTHPGVDNFDVEEFITVREEGFNVYWPEKEIQMQLDVQGALLQLEPKDRKLVWEVTVNGVPLRDLEREFRCSIATLSRRLEAAKGTLRSILAEYAPKGKLSLTPG